MGRLIQPRDIVRNKHYPNLVYRCLPSNKGYFGHIASSGYLGHGGVTNPAHWELAPQSTWWNSAIRYFLTNLLRWLTYRTDRNLGLVGREVNLPHDDKSHRSLHYPYHRARLMFGILPNEQLC